MGTEGIKAGKEFERISEVDQMAVVRERVQRAFPRAAEMISKLTRDIHQAVADASAEVSRANAEELHRAFEAVKRRREAEGLLCPETYEDYTYVAKWAGVDDVDIPAQTPLSVDEKVRSRLRIIEACERADIAARKRAAEPDRRDPAVRINTGKTVREFDTIEEYAAAVNAENERRFRKAARDSMTRIAPGDKDKPVDQQRRITRDAGTEPIVTREGVTNCILTALNCLANPRWTGPNIGMFEHEKGGIVDLLSLEPSGTRSSHEQRYEVAFKLHVFDREYRRLAECFSRLLDDDAELINGLIDMCASKSVSAISTRRWTWERMVASRHDCSIGLLNHFHTNFTGFDWGPHQSYPTLWAYVDVNWDELVDQVRGALTCPLIEPAGQNAQPTRDNVIELFRDVSAEGRRLRTVFGNAYTGKEMAQVAADEGAHAIRAHDQPRPPAGDNGEGTGDDSQSEAIATEAASGAKDGASDRVDAEHEQVDPPTGEGDGLTTRQRNILQALAEADATSDDRSMTIAHVARKVDGEGAAVSSFKRPAANLTKRGLTDSKDSPDGGIWLTDDGQSVARQR